MIVYLVISSCKNIFDELLMTFFFMVLFLSNVMNMELSLFKCNKMIFFQNPDLLSVLCHLPTANRRKILFYILMYFHYQSSFMDIYTENETYTTVKAIRIVACCFLILYLGNCLSFWPFWNLHLQCNLEHEYYMFINDQY